MERQGSVGKQKPDKKGNETATANKRGSHRQASETGTKTRKGDKAATADKTRGT